MTLKFKTQDFKTDAVNAVADLFAVQSQSNTRFPNMEENVETKLVLECETYEI